MKDFIDFKGHFRIESLDANNNIIDFHEDKNMIMIDARTSMAEIFSGQNTSVSVNRLVLGTMGHVEKDYLAPKTNADGFVNERNRLFSEVLSSSIGNILPVLDINDVIYIPDATVPGYYRYMKVKTVDYTLSLINVADTFEWEYLGVKAPYTYGINFDLPGTSIDLVQGDPVLNLIEDDLGSGTSINVLRQDSSVIFDITIVPVAGNLQDLVTSVFTEAALYANGRIFSMKTFKGKIKDNTVSLRIVWKITF